MALPAEQCPFVEKLPEADAEDAFVGNVASARVTTRSFKWRIGVAAVVAFAVAAVFALSQQPASNMDVASVSATIEESLTKVKGEGFLFNGVLLHKPFAQCAGEGFTNSSCCFKGCACIKQSKFYSQCETPLGNKVCNLEKAVLQSEAWKDRIATRTRISKTADMRVQQGLKMVKDAKEAHQKAATDAKKPIIEWSTKKKAAEAKLKEENAKVEEVKKTATKAADDLEHDAKAKWWDVCKAENAKRNDKQSIANELRTKADAAKKRSDDKAKEKKDVTEELAKFAKDDKARKKLTTIPAIFNDCTGTDLCALGCKCQWKGKFYAQCAGVDGGAYCNWKPAAARNKKLGDELPQIESDDKKFKKEKVDTEKAAVEAEKIALDVGTKANTTIAAAKEVMDTKIAPAEGVKEAKIKKAQDEADSKTADCVAEEKAAAVLKDDAVKNIHEKAHKLAYAEKHLESVKTSAKKAKEAIEEGKGASEAWALAADAKRCLKDSDNAKLA